LKWGISPSNRREDLGLVGVGAKMVSGRFKSTVYNQRRKPHTLSQSIEKLLHLEIGFDRKNNAK
jgi:hypothetical protein